MRWLRAQALIWAGAALSVLATSEVSADLAEVSLTPLDCAPPAETMPTMGVPDKARTVLCPDGASAFDVLVVTNADMSWPVLLSADRSRSLEDFLLRAMEPFGAGLLFFNKARDGVWVASDGGGARSYVVSLSGNDPVTMRQKGAFLLVSTDPAVAPSLHETLGEALDRVVAP